jgi:hypothetical protein
MRGLRLVLATAVAGLGLLLVGAAPAGAADGLRKCGSSSDNVYKVRSDPYSEGARFRCSRGSKLVKWRTRS